MSEAGYRVFLSAVTSEFGKARNEIASDLTARGLTVKVQRDFRQEAETETTLAKLDKYIRGCDAVVHVAGKRSGSFPGEDEARPYLHVLPPGVTRASLTQFEFHLARHHRRTFYIYIAKPDYVPDEPAATSADEDAASQIDHIGRLQKLDRDYFSTVDQLCRLALKPDWSTLGRLKPMHRYLSYAWADETDRQREEKVDATCAEADKRGVLVLRDKKVLTRGDTISNFMRAIGRGDRVFIFLSEKYLRSPFCMFEMYCVWLHSRQNEDDFCRRVRLFVLDDARIWTPKDRLRHAIYWYNEFQEMERELKASSPSLLGPNDQEAHRRTMEFALNVARILEEFADRVQPKSFDEFLQWGFDDPPSGDV